MLLSVTIEKIGKNQNEKFIKIYMKYQRERGKIIQFTLLFCSFWTTVFLWDASIGKAYTIMKLSKKYGFDICVNRKLIYPELKFSNPLRSRVTKTR